MLNTTVIWHKSVLGLERAVFVPFPLGQLKNRSYLKTAFPLLMSVLHMTKKSQQEAGICNKQLYWESMSHPFIDNVGLFNITTDAEVVKHAFCCQGVAGY